MNGLSISQDFGYEFNPSSREHIERENKYWELWPPMPGDIVRARTSFPGSDVIVGDTFVILRESTHGSSGPCFPCASTKNENHIVPFWQGFFRVVERSEHIVKEASNYYKTITSEEELVS